MQGFITKVSPGNRNAIGSISVSLLQNPGQFGTNHCKALARLGYTIGGFKFGIAMYNTLCFARLVAIVIYPANKIIFLLAGSILLQGKFFLFNGIGRRRKRAVYIKQAYN